METTDYVSYPIALALKKSGFDVPCNSYYDKACIGDDEHWQTMREEVYNWNGLGSECQISAPTLWQAQKWLREEKRISVRVNYMLGSSRWFADWLHLDSGEYGDADTAFATYEAALAAGIAAAMELIKKGE